MPSDLQLIDGFERLREEFAQSNPGYAPPTALPPVGASEGWVVEAWIQAAAGGRGAAAALAAQPRRVRALARAILAGEPPPTSAGNPWPAALLDQAAHVPQGLEQARRGGLWPLNESAPARSLIEEVRAWRKALPGLGGLRGWRFLERLGRPVIVPVMALRRFFWRLGLLEEISAGHCSESMLVSLIERLRRLTNLSAETLGLLLRWHLGGTRDLAGGRWCVKQPRCALCPLRPGCTWVRFHPAPPLEGAARPDRRLLATLSARVVAEKQDQLQESELLAIVLERGSVGGDVLGLAETLLRRFGGLRGMEHAAIAELAQTPGISVGRAIRLKAALELGRRLAECALQQGDAIACSKDVWRAYRHRFRDLPQEHFVILLLDAKNRVLHDQIVSKGTLTGSLAHPREVFQGAIRHAAAGVILMHNHPSGDPNPSAEDRTVTTRLKDAGEILGIRVLDHIILGADHYYSFKDEGRM